MTRSTRSIVYLGWQGFGNFGDDLLHDTWQAVLDDPLDVTAPLNPRDYVRGAPRFLRDRARMLGSARIVLLGGGTTIGFETWAEHARVARRAFGAAGVVGTGLGAAAATDGFSVGRQRQRWDLWRALEGLRVAGVRGPITAAEVDAHLWPVEVSGDPALLWPRVRPPLDPGAASPGRIGVSLGSEPRSRFDLDVVAAAVDRRAAESGATEVVAFALSGTDRMTANALAERLRTPTTVHRYTDVRTTMQAIGACDLVVSERLHGAIAAVSLGVATVPLSYASKCDDFWMSVTGEPSPITLGHTADALVAAMRAAPAAQAGIGPRIAVLQDRLTAIGAELTAWRDGTRPTAALLSRDTRAPHPTSEATRR